MERRRSSGVMLWCYAGLIAGLIGPAVGHDFVMVFAAITLAATLVQAGSFTLMGLAPQYYPTIRRGVGIGAAVAAARTGAVCGPAKSGFLSGVGFGPSQVILSLVPVVLAAGLSAGLLLVTGKPINHQMTIEVSKDE